MGDIPAGHGLVVALYVICCVEFMSQGDVEQDQTEVYQEWYQPVLDECLAEVPPLKQYNVLHHLIREQPWSLGRAVLQIGNEGLGTPAVEDPWEFDGFEIDGLILYLLFVWAFRVEQVQMVGLIFEPRLVMVHKVEHTRTICAVVAVHL